MHTKQCYSFPRSVDKASRTCRCKKKYLDKEGHLLGGACMWYAHPAIADPASYNHMALVELHKWHALPPPLSSW
ncbi:hypothetical protein BC826DRAFT_1047841 [Russula brevipes]|nr:hypothetical protein BC826DRAFT_1047841 [Russula brevipes]